MFHIATYLLSFASALAHLEHQNYNEEMWDGQKDKKKKSSDWHFNYYKIL